MLNIKKLISNRPRFKSRSVGCFEMLREMVKKIKTHKEKKEHIPFAKSE